MTDQKDDTKYPIPGWNGYFITKDGHVYSTKINPDEPVELKGWHNPDGYVKVGLSEDGMMRSYSVHKLLELTFMGGPKPGLQIDHIDGNKDNNSIENLRQVTPYENRHNPVTAKRAQEVMSSCEYRARLKSIMQEKFKDEAYRERVKKAATKRINDPGWQKNHAIAMKEVFSRPEMQKQIYDNLDKMNNDPEMRAYNAQRSKEVNSRKCRAYKDNGEEMEFDSITKCAEYLGISPKTINRCMRLKTPNKNGGWKFVRLDKLNDE